MIEMTDKQTRRQTNERDNRQTYEQWQETLSPFSIIQQDKFIVVTAYLAETL